MKTQREQLKAQANHRAWEIWQDARKTAASYQNIEEWQRLNRVTVALNKAHPIYSKLEC